MGDNVNLWLDPFVPQTVGIMQTANIGMGVSIALDNSGAPKGSQGWNPSLNGQEVPMDPNNLRVFLEVFFTGLSPSLISARIAVGAV